MKRIFISIIAAAWLLIYTMSTVSAATPFTFQGLLENDGQPVSGDRYFVFDLFSSPTGTVPIASSITQTISVTDGLFIARLDFSDADISGYPIWLQVSVREFITESWDVLSPRFEMLPDPWLVTMETETDYDVELPSGGTAVIDMSATAGDLILAMALTLLVLFAAYTQLEKIVKGAKPK